MSIALLTLHSLHVPCDLKFDLKDCKNLKLWLLPAHAILLAVKPSHRSAFPQWTGIHCCLLSPDPVRGEAAGGDE